MTLTGAPGAGDGGSEPRPYRIILVDPQRLFRQALRALLDAQAGFSVVGETGSAAEALELAGAQGTPFQTSGGTLGERLSAATQQLRPRGLRLPG